MLTKLLPSSAGWLGEKKCKNCVGQDESSLLKTKDVWGSKGGQKMYSLLPISRRSPGTSWGAGLGYSEQLLLKTNIVTRNALLLLSQLLLLSRCCVMGNIPGVSCPGCPLRSCPAPLTGEEAALVLGQPCSAAAKTLGWCQHLSAYQGTVQHCQGSWD